MWRCLDRHEKVRQKCKWIWEIFRIFVHLGLANRNDTNLMAVLHQWPCDPTPPPLQCFWESPGLSPKCWWMSVTLHGSPMPCPRGLLTTTGCFAVTWARWGGMSFAFPSVLSVLEECCLFPNDYTAFIEWFFEDSLLSRRCRGGQWGRSPPAKPILTVPLTSDNPAQCAWLHLSLELPSRAKAQVWGRGWMWLSQAVT